MHGRATKSLVLFNLKVGERHYAETSPAKYMQDSHAWNPAPSRRPPEIMDYQFKTEVFTCVARGDGSIRHVICVERTK